MRFAVLLLGLLACNTPPPSLRIRLNDGVTQACPSLSCADVPLACKTWISIRIIDPADPSAPFLSQCQEIPRNRNRDLCSVASVDLEPIALPVKDLEVQVALYPESMITTDPLTGDDVCPSDTQYDAVDGFPVENAVTPALGGRTYYRPGDEVVTVTLGCTNLEVVNDVSCVGLATVRVSATVEDFDRAASVTEFEANRLSVGVGEPRSENTTYVLNPGDVTALGRTVSAPPAWAIDVEQLFTSTACLSVLDDTPQSTTAVTCKTVNVVDDMIEFTGDPPGVRLTKASLDQILRALSLTQFPAQGLTIGIVLDRNGVPLATQVVAAPGATVLYLSSDRNSVVGSSTSGGPLGGVFVSLDAPFGTVFSTSGGTPIQTPDALGGRIENKVTIVVLKFTAPVIGGT